MVFHRDRRRKDDRVVDQLCTRQAARAVHIVRRDAADRFNREIGAQKIFCRNRRDKAVAGLRLRSGGKADAARSDARANLMGRFFISYPLSSILYFALEEWAVPAR